MRRQIVAQNPPDRCIQWYLAILAAFAVFAMDIYVAASRTDGYVPDLKAAAVSYTHLDVYKRQDTCRIMILIGFRASYV